MLAALALLALSVPVPVFSEMTDMSMKKHGEGHGHTLELNNIEKVGDMIGMCVEHADKLGITDEQILKMKPVISEMQKKQARFNADLKIAEIDFLEIMEVKNFDLENAGKAVKKIAERKTAHNLEMLKAMREMRTILTDEQLKKMKKMTSFESDEKKPSKKPMKKHHTKGENEK
jgi:Spy/CpxP family protein refolding chaperone